MHENLNNVAIRSQDVSSIVKEMEKTYVPNTHAFVGPPEKYLKKTC